MRMNKKQYIITMVILLCMTITHSVRSQSVTDSVKPNLSFQEFLNQVGKNNLNYLAEKYNVSIADAEVIAQKVLPDPSLVLEGGKDTYKVGLEYSLELGNKRGARVNLARSQADFERLALEGFYQDLRAEAANLYLDAIQQRELLKIKTSSYEYMQQLSVSDSIRFKLGDINQTDLRQSKLETSTLLSEVYEQEAAYKAALASLNQCMGRVSENLETPLGNWDVKSRDYILGNLLSIGVTNRVDLLAAQKSVEVATNQQKLVRAERKMDITLSANYEHDWFGNGDPTKTTTGGISIPLQFSNRNKGALKAARSGIEQSRIKQQSTELQVQTEISQAFFYYEAAQKKVKLYESGLLDESKKILESIVYKYKRGETDIMEVLIAQRTYNEVQEQYTETMKGYVSSLVELQKVSGIWDIDF